MSNDTTRLPGSPRQYTDLLLEMLDEGRLTDKQVILACVLYMSEHDVQDMMEHNNFIEPDCLEEEFNE